ncbi:MAG: alcohol dehydrogenase [Candidatus Chloroheliales bacterium]|nr:MAG: alcohol dehydrogenase [Chloroflexota bacterium]
MKALVYNQQGRVQLERDWPQPQPAPHEALVKVRLAGICNTDIEISRGYKGWHGVLGHEFVGEVAAVNGEESEQLLGRRVVGEINIACGDCARCLADMPSHCARRTVLGIQGRDGSLAEFLTLPLANLHLVPDSIADEEAVFTEPLAAACEILTQVQIGAEDKVAVLGDGKLGQLCAQVLALTGCRLVAIGRHHEKLELLKRRGIAVLLTEEASGLGEFDIVVDATGSATGFAAAVAMLRPRGTLVLKSTYAGKTEVDLSQLVVNEINLVGSRCGPFADALLLLKQGAVDVRPLISATYSLDDAELAFQHAQAAGTLKVIVDCRL